MVQFVDEVLIKVTAGNGGNGCCSFRREKYIPMGGPDGGDGGRGGSVFIIADRSCSSLIALRYKMHQKAENGKHGSGQNKVGAKGKDLFIKVPVGTQIQHLETNEVLGEVLAHDEKYCIAKGGDPGLGNVHFKSSRNRAPRKCTKGYIGEYIELKLSLRVLADVGLVGLPNAGKSSLISVISAATPKIADYPFTTIRPHLGVVEVDTSLSFVMADIPGLIAGAADGQGLGTYFLKHLSRCKLLLHLISLEHELDTIIENYHCIMSELENYDEKNLAKPMIMVFTKADLMHDAQIALKVKEILQNINTNMEPIVISSIQRKGTKELVFKVAQMLGSS